MPKTSKIESVVFDLGGVLIDWNPRYLYRKIFDDEETISWFLKEICNRPWHEQQDGGRPTSEAPEALVGAHPNYENEIRAFYDRFEEMLGGPLHDTVEILSTLKGQSIPLFALSNWPAETFPNARTPYEFLEWFDGLVISGHEKVMKPDFAIFEILCHRHDLEASTTLFIDDVLTNIEAARHLGFITHHFKNAAGLAEALTEHGMMNHG